MRRATLCKAVGTAIHEIAPRVENLVPRLVPSNVDALDINDAPIRSRTPSPNDPVDVQMVSQPPSPPTRTSHSQFPFPVEKFDECLKCEKAISKQHLKIACQTCLGNFHGLCAGMKEEAFHCERCRELFEEASFDEEDFEAVADLVQAIKEAAVNVEGALSESGRLFMQKTIFKPFFAYAVHVEEAESETSEEMEEYDEEKGGYDKGMEGESSSSLRPVRKAADIARKNLPSAGNDGDDSSDDDDDGGRLLASRLVAMRSSVRQHEGFNVGASTSQGRASSTLAAVSVNVGDIPPTRPLIEGDLYQACLNPNFVAPGESFFLI